MTKKLLYTCILSFALSSAAPSHAGWLSSITKIAQTAATSISSWWSDKGNQKATAVVAGIAAIGGFFVWKMWRRSPMSDAAIQTEPSHDRSKMRERALHGALRNKREKTSRAALGRWKLNATKIDLENKRKKAIAEIEAAHKERKVKDASVQTEQQERKLVAAGIQTDPEIKREAAAHADASAQTDSEIKIERSVAHPQTQTAQAEMSDAQAIETERERKARVVADVERLLREEEARENHSKPLPEPGANLIAQVEQKKEASRRNSASEEIIVDKNPIADDADQIEAHVGNCLHRVNSGENISLEELSFVKDQLQQLHAAREAQINAAPAGERQKLRDLFLSTAAQWPKELEDVLMAQQAEEAELQADWQPILVEKIDKKIIEDARTCHEALRQKQKVEPAVIDLHVKQLELLRMRYFAKVQRGTDPKKFAEQLEATYIQNMRTATANFGETYGPLDGYKALGMSNEAGRKLRCVDVLAKINKELEANETPLSRKLALRQIQTLFANDIAKKHYDHFLAGTLERLKFNSANQQKKLMQKFADVIQLKAELDGLRTQDKPRISANSADLVRSSNLPNGMNGHANGANGHGAQIPQAGNGATVLLQAAKAAQT